MNRLLSTGMPNIHLKVTIEKNVEKLIFHVLKICHQASFGELQLTKISFNFKTSCYYLKIRILGAKLCVALVLF